MMCRSTSHPLSAGKPFFLTTWSLVFSQPSDGLAALESSNAFDHVPTTLFLFLLAVFWPIPEDPASKDSVSSEAEKSACLSALIGTPLFSVLLQTDIV